MVKPVTWLKLGFLLYLQKGIEEKKKREQPYPEDTDPRIPKTQEILDRMAERDRTYYLPTYEMICGYYGYKFFKPLRFRGKKDIWWCGHVDGALIFRGPAGLFAGQLRYTMGMYSFRASAKMPKPMDVVAFFDYMNIYKKRTGNVTVHVKWGETKLPNCKDLFPKVKRYFTEEELKEIEVNGWLE